MTLSFLRREDFHVTENGKIYFTYSDLLKLPEWPNSPLLEIINGELFMPPSPSIYHQEISDNLLFHIKQYLMTNRLGKIFSAPIDVVLSEKDVVIPDLTYISLSNLDIEKKKRIKGSPDLIIEILSSNRENDEIRKFKLYEKYKVLEYWIVDPNEKSITKYLLEANKFNDGEKYVGSDELSSTVVKGLRLQLSLIFHSE